VKLPFLFSDHLTFPFSLTICHHFERSNPPPSTWTRLKYNLQHRHNRTHGEATEVEVEVEAGAGDIEITIDLGTTRIKDMLSQRIQPTPKMATQEA
jgi:hypothetical protein